MNLNQIPQLIKAIAFLLLILLLGYITYNLLKPKENVTSSDKVVDHIDSIIITIPYVLPESTRTIFLDNYQKDCACVS